MKTTSIVGVAAAAIGLVVGSQLPKSGTAGYTVITGTTKIERPLMSISNTLINSLKNVDLLP